MNYQSLESQIEILRKYFPKIKTPNNLPNIPLPNGAESVFAIPRWEKIGSTYNEALEIVLAVLERTHKPFVNYREVALGPDRLRQSKETVHAFQKLESWGDFYLVPAQLGSKYLGKSMDTVRKEFTANEFGLGALEVACILITHPNLLKEGGGIDCPGDEFDFSGGDARWAYGPCFWRNDGLRFGPHWSYYAGGGSIGSASGFLPKLNMDSHTFEIPRLILELGEKRYEVNLKEIHD